MFHRSFLISSRPIFTLGVRFLSLRPKLLQRFRKKSNNSSNGSNDNSSHSSSSLGSGNKSSKRPNRFKYKLMNFTKKVVNFRTASRQVQRLTVQQAVDRICSPAVQKKIAHLPHRVVARWRAVMLPHVAFGGASEGNTLKVYHDGSSCYRDIWSTLENASHCIKMEAYTFEPDTVGLKTLALLEQAARRGVKVQLIYDCWGSLRLEERHTAGLRAAGGVVIPFAPLMRVSGRGFMFRNHRKLLLVDHRVAFAGGMNMGDEYAGADVGGNGYYRDTHLQLHGPCVDDLDKVFQDSVFEAYFSNPALARQLGLVIPTRLRWWFSWLATPEANYDAGKQFACVDCPTCHSVPTANTPTNSSDVPSDPSSLRETSPNMSTSSDFACTTTPSSGSAATFMSGLNPRHVTTMEEREEKQQAITSFAETTESTAVASSVLSNVALEETVTIPSTPSSHSTPSSASSSSSSNTSYYDISLQVLQSNIWREKRDIQRALSLALEKSHRKCYITNPYFLPPPRLKRALRNAITTHGSDVRILMAGAGYSDVPVVQWACQHVYYFLLKHGARVFELQNKVLHAKTVTVDGVYGSVGSFNFDNFSNNCNLELAVSAVMCPDFTAELERQFLVDISNAHEITLQNLARRPWYLKLGHAIAYYITQAPTMFPWYPHRIRRRTSVA